MKKSVLIGSDNCSNQGFRWAQQLRIIGYEAYNIGPINETWDFPAHIKAFNQFVHGRRVSLDKVKNRNNFLKRNKNWIFSNKFDFCLIEYFNPIVNHLGIASTKTDIKFLEKNCIDVSLIAHGSDLIIPEKHMEIEQFSPHHDLSLEMNSKLTKHAKLFNKFINNSENTIFVSTLNLKVFQPRSIWLPVIASNEYFLDAPREFRKVPLVVHIPSDPLFKGTKHIEPVLIKLAEKGLITYLRPQKLRSQEVFRLIEKADVVVDQIGFGSYGVLGAESLAASKIVLGHVNDFTRKQLGDEIPITEVSPDTLEDVLFSYIRNPDLVRINQKKSYLFARKYHDGRFSGGVLNNFFIKKKEPKSFEKMIPSKR